MIERKSPIASADSLTSKAVHVAKRMMMMMMMTVMTMMTMMIMMMMMMMMIVTG